MKKKFFRPCFALLLSMVLLFGGVRWDAAAIGDVSPFGPVLPPSAVTFTVSAPRAVMSNEETMQMSYSATPSNGSIAWSSSNTSVATVNSSGLVTAVGAGKTTITGRYTYNGTVYTDSVSIEVYTLRNSIGISNSTEYYIMNASSGRLLSLENDSDANFTKAYTHPRFAMTLSQWRTRKLSDGYYNIQSVYSPTGKCLDVTNNNLDIYNDNGAGYLRFTLRRVENGTYEGLYLIRHTNSGLYVTQGSNYYVYVTATPTEASYWSFMPVVKREAEFFYLNYPLKDQNGNPETDENGRQLYFRTHENRFLFESVFEDLGYTASSHENANPPYALNSCMIDKDDIFVYTGHGSPGRIAFYNYSGDVSGVIASKNLSVLYEGSDNVNIESLQENVLARLRMVIYMGCETGVSYNYLGSHYTNLVDETFNKGAHFVLGTTEILLTNHTNDWLEYFFTYLNAGYNIEEAVEGAITDLGPITVSYNDEMGNEVVNEYDEMPLYDRGDKKQYLNIN